MFNVYRTIHPSDPSSATVDIIIGQVDANGNIYERGSATPVGRVDDFGVVYHHTQPVGRVDISGGIYTAMGHKVGRVDDFGKVYDTSENQIGGADTGQASNRIRLTGGAVLVLVVILHKGDRED